MTANDNAVRLFPVEGLTDGTASDDTTIIDVERAERGRQLYEQADHIIENWPTAWERIEALAESDFQAGRRMVIGRYAEDVRCHEHIGIDGQGIAFSNNARAALARRLVQAHPDYAERMELRPSICDEYDLLASGELS